MRYTVIHLKYGNKKRLVKVCFKYKQKVLIIVFQTIIIVVGYGGKFRPNMK